MKRLIWTIALCMLGYAGVLISGVLFESQQQRVLTYSNTAALDTNRITGTTLLKSPLIEGGMSRYTGVQGYVYVSGITNPGDAAFGNVDTAILTYYTSFGGGGEIVFFVDTLAGLPATSTVYNDKDSVWNATDNFYLRWYLADSTEDYADSDDTIVCTLQTFMRILKE